MPDTKAVKVRIAGQVQGVLFRVWTRSEAEKLSVMGWVRNRLDGEVEALFVGSGEAVDALIAIVGEGPSGATVTEVRVEEAQGITEVGFNIKPTV